MPGAEPIQPMTYAEYLALEETSEAKHEYVNGVVYAMAGGTPEHSRLAANMTIELGSALRANKRPCAVHTSDARLRISATARSTYPDVAVVCGNREVSSDDSNAITNPVVLVEVLSDSAESSDRGEKIAHYRHIPSLREYVLVSQKERRIEVFRRDGDAWVMREALEGQSIVLDSLGVTLDVDAVYENPVPE